MRRASVLAVTGSLLLLVASCSDGGPAGTDEGAAPTEQPVITSAESEGDAADDTATTVESPTTTTPPETTTTTEPDPAEALGLTLAAAERGDSGDHVVDLQTRLNDIGFTAGTADGDYGRRTERAVAAFQKVVGLVQTGTVNEATIDALYRYDYDGLVVTVDDEGPKVEQLQELLATGPFDPGVADGEYGTRTVQAVWALEKLAGIPVDGNWGPADDWAFQRLLDGRLGAPVHSHEDRWVEVDLSEQLLKVYDPGSDTPVLISHISSGSGIPWANEEHSGSSITPIGSFHIQRRISGWRESSLDIGRLYNPLYFVGGIAFHGALSVPNYPASHGCVRVPMHIAEYLPGELPNGTAVHVMA